MLPPQPPPASDAPHGDPNQRISPESSPQRSVVPCGTGAWGGRAKPAFKGRPILAPAYGRSTGPRRAGQTKETEDPNGWSARRTLPDSVASSLCRLGCGRSPRLKQSSPATAGVILFVPSCPCAFVPSSSFLRFPPSAILSPAVSFWPVEPSRPTTDHGVDMANEADTCRQFVVPKRQARVDRLKALQAQTAAERDALLPAILDRAFKGEL